MGYPSTGIEGFYRNRREDARKFLEHHHGNNIKEFNFCPATENSYPHSVFDHRVSRSQTTSEFHVLIAVAAAVNHGTV